MNPINPGDWTPLVVAVGGTFAAIVTSIITLIAAWRTGQKADAIHTLVNSKMDAAEREIKRLSGIVEQFSKSGKPITEQEAGLILNKVIEVANGHHPAIAEEHQNPPDPPSPGPPAKPITIPVPGSVVAKPVLLNPVLPKDKKKA